MAYGTYNSAQPAGTDLGTAVPGEIKSNTNALRDMIGAGMMQGFDLTVTVGTGSAAQPQFLIWKNGTTWLRATPTWGSGAGTDGNWTSVVWELSINSGADYTTAPGGAIATATNTFDSSGNLTATSGGFSSFISWLMSLMGKMKTLAASFATHIATTGTGVHGLAGMSTQSPAAVAVTGGTVDGTSIGSSTPSDMTATRYRGKVINLGNITGNPFNVDWSSGDTFFGTLTGNATIVWQNLPPNLLMQAITMEITNPGAFVITWPAGLKWPGGATPVYTVSGVDYYEFSCRDNSTVRAVQAEKDTR